VSIIVNILMDHTKWMDDQIQPISSVPDLVHDVSSVFVPPQLGFNHPNQQNNASKEHVLLANNTSPRGKIIARVKRRRQLSTKRPCFDFPSSHSSSSHFLQQNPTQNSSNSGNISSTALDPINNNASVFNPSFIGVNSNGSSNNSGPSAFHVGGNSTNMSSFHQNNIQPSLPHNTLEANASVNIIISHVQMLSKTIMEKDIEIQHLRDHIKGISGSIDTFKQETESKLQQLESLKKSFGQLTGDRLEGLGVKDLDKIEQDLLQALQKVKVARSTQEERLKECKICNDAESKIVFVPCGHLCTCEKCSLMLDVCVICRQRIQQKVKTFNS